MSQKTKKNDGHKAGAAVLVRMSQEQRKQINEAVQVIEESLPRGARTSVTAWILAQALEAARQVTAAVTA